MRSHSGGDRFLRALRDDRSGNVLAITAAALIPMMALIGGGVDVSRAYMAQTQLQSACDAGVLAGRRAMSKTGDYGNSEKAKANNMFTFNFNPSTFEATNVTYVTEDNDDGQVVGTATATVPTLVMKLFDKQTIDLSVECMAELQIGNADIMFVLDTTGSMGNSISWGEPTKIEGLRSAVRDFHKTINQAVNDNRTRIRYGFVPYSMTVNVKGLLENGDMPYDFMADSTRYQSRLAVFDTPVYEIDEVENLGSVTETYSYSNGTPIAITSGNCDKYGDNRYPSYGDNPYKTGGAPSPLVVKEYDYVSWTITGSTGSGKNKVYVGTCVRRVWTTRTTYELAGYKFRTWRYTQVPIDTSRLKRFDNVAVATNISNAMTDSAGAYDPVRLAQMNGSTASGVGTTNYAWNGCIEERKTVTPTTALPTFDPWPEDAYDLDLNLTPFDEDSRWKPHWNSVEYSRSNYDYEDSTSSRNTASGSCPSPMMLLNTVELSDNADDVPAWLDTYLNNLVATGNTYHDIGMIWGGRLTSPGGLFASNVNLDADKINVSKHIIFMTDGIMEPTASGYSAYGIENLDSRIAPRYYANTITARHNLRFTAMCNAIKAQGTTIWVIAFGTSMTTELQNCASNGRAYYSSNTEQLRNTFKFIAAQVADLRLGR